VISDQGYGDELWEIWGLSLQVVRLCRQKYWSLHLECECNFIYSRTGYNSRWFKFYVFPLVYPKADIPRQWTLGGYVVYTCKMPAVVEGFKKIRVAFFKINDWINDGICNLNLIFAGEINISDVARFFCEPRNDGWVGGCQYHQTSRTCGCLTTYLLHTMAHLCQKYLSISFLYT
jgi:hypothetical protein